MYIASIFFLSKKVKAGSTSFFRSNILKYSATLIISSFEENSISSLFNTSVFFSYPNMFANASLANINLPSILNAIPSEALLTIEVNKLGPFI